MTKTATNTKTKTLKTMPTGGTLLHLLMSAQEILPPLWLRVLRLHLHTYVMRRRMIVMMVILMIMISRMMMTQAFLQVNVSMVDICNLEVNETRYRKGCNLSLSYAV